MANGVRPAASRLRDYPEKYQRCRRRRHQMEDAGTFLLRGTGRERFVVFRYECLTCTTKRTDIWDRNKELVDRRYEYPPDYPIQYTKEEREAGQTVTGRLIIEQLINDALRNKNLPEYVQE